MALETKRGAKALAFHEIFNVYGLFLVIYPLLPRQTLAKIVGSSFHILPFNHASDNFLHVATALPPVHAFFG